VITKDVPDDALAVERNQQVNREGGAKRIREMKTKAKTPKA
jgi:bifunctional UDP-N-acetylglucosamine pyrophosphorylase/glucosamine-1-phosphate N-acetyltransferase